MVKFHDVKNQTNEEYFHNNQFSIDAFKKKYAKDENETYVQALNRVCKYIASAEPTEELKKYWEERWFDEIYNDWFHPAGSIMQGAGVESKISLMNCTHIGLPHDSLECLFRYTEYKVAKTAAFRQGLGIHFDKIRPSKSKVNNSSKESQGVIHWMKKIDNTGYFIGQRGRIPAMLMSLSVNHPDVMEFIKVKSDYSTIQNANISVHLTNKFYKAVENDKDWEMEFIVPEVKLGEKIYLDSRWDDIRLADGEDDNGHYTIAKFSRPKEVIQKTEKAVKILELIAKMMHANAEPGIQNIDIARKYSNSDAVGFPIIGTNACSEQYLDNLGNCCLASIFCGAFFDKENKFNRVKLKEISTSINRFLDNVVEMELISGRYAAYEQKISLESLRRVGAGFTDIVSLLFQNNLEYGSDEGNKLIENFIEDYNYFLYVSSIELGNEKGSFKAFDKEKYTSATYVKNMIKKFPNMMDFDTMRNVCVSSVAPTGTLSLMNSNSVLSYGIEPSFGLYYWKRTRISGKYEYYFVLPKVVKDVFKEHGIEIKMESDSIKDTWDGKYGKEFAKIIDDNIGKCNIKFKDATDIKVSDKLDLMARVQKLIDSSISVTYMLPEKSTWKDVYNFILLAHEKELKSIAAFPDRKMYGIISQIPFKELAFKLKNENIEIHSQNFSPEEQAEINIFDTNITNAQQAPKRPKILEADIYVVNVKNEKFLMCIGLLNGKPYEVFGGNMNGFAFKFQHKKGKIEKIKRGHYKLEIGDEIEVDNFGEKFTPVEQATFRLVSTSLRHGVPLQYIVEQLQKSEDDMFSLSSAAARVLKKYIVDGSKATGMSCPSCGSVELSYSEGCVSCKCGWSRCQ